MTYHYDLRIEDWKPGAVQMAARRWYVDLWPETGHAAYWGGEFNSFGSARLFINAVRRPNEIIRVIPPIDASRIDLDGLRKLRSAAHLKRTSRFL
jgi:hypothetical protein